MAEDENQPDAQLQTEQTVPTEAQMIGFQAAADDVENYEKFLTKETPYYKSHVMAEAVSVMADAIKSDTVGSADVRANVRNAAANYWTKEVMESSLSDSKMTKNLALKTIFETITGIDEDLLGQLMEDGKDIDGESMLQLGNTANRTYGRWAQGLVMSNLRSAVKSDKGRNMLEGKVNSWNKEFKIGIDEDTLKDDQKLMRAYMSGLGRQQEYASAVAKGPIYRPSN